MKILLGSQTFHPDHSGIAVYATDMAKYMAEQGHQVTVVTGFPFYPHWKKRVEDRGRFFRCEEHFGVRILRGYLYVPERVTTLKRMIHEASFFAFACLNFLRAPRQDCIIVVSPPLLLGVLGVCFKYLWRCQLVVHVQDLQTDAAKSLSMIRQNWLVGLLFKVERFIYRRSTWVATITPGMWRRLVDKGVAQDKLEICYNWIDVVAASRRQVTGRFRSQYPEIANKFLVAYAGNIGIKQGVDILVRAAEAMRDEPGVQFLIIGEGADKPRLVQFAKERNLENLTMLPFFGDTQEDYYDMLRDIDISFVAQKAHAGNVFFPSKLLGIMAMSKPLLVSADLDSELATEIAGAGAGLISAADDVASLVDNIRKLVRSPELVQELGRNGRQKVEEFDRSRVLSGFMLRVETEHKQSLRSHMP